ncbi:MAG TPA: threo-3-hydroxy-L-aspartate ammonia-lyase [Candidatus Eisenbacteria bacterium]
MTARLLAARTALEGVAHRTPVATSSTLDERVQASVFLKCENLQRAGAFKFRGAWNAISRLPEEARRRGVVAYSSGNHAQAVALVARRLGIPAAIVMPAGSSALKLAATRDYGAEVVLCGPGAPGAGPGAGAADRAAVAERLALERGCPLVPPFDHPDVIAGQGTAAAELIEDAGSLDALLVPVGGGGLISGSALAARRLSPGCRVIGVEPEGGDDGVRSFHSGRLERVENPRTIADGARTPSLGRITFPLIRQLVSDMVAVPDAALIDAMRFVWERMKLVVEPTGVLGLAALTSGRVKLPGMRVGVILSGGNVDPVAARAWLGGDAR